MRVVLYEIVKKTRRISGNTIKITSFILLSAISWTKIKQNGVETKEGAIIRTYSSGHGCPIVKQKVKGEVLLIGL